MLAAGVDNTALAVVAASCTVAGAVCWSAPLAVGAVEATATGAASVESWLTWSKMLAICAAADRGFVTKVGLKD